MTEHTAFLSIVGRGVLLAFHRLDSHIQHRMDQGELQRAATMDSVTQGIAPSATVPNIKPDPAASDVQMLSAKDLKQAEITAAEVEGYKEQDVSSFRLFSRRAHAALALLVSVLCDGTSPARAGSVWCG